MKQLLSIVLMCLVGVSAMAQRVTANFHETSMSEALLTVEHQCKNCRINFIYDELEDFTITQSIYKQPVGDALRLIAGFYPIRITHNGNIFSVECVQKASAKVTGRILDEKGQPFPLVNVVLLSARDSSFVNGGVSNNNGDVVIPCSNKNVIAKISFVGYKTQYRHCVNGVLGTIKMTENTIALKQVKVKGYVPQYKMSQGGMSVDIHNSILSQIGTANDVLSQLPRVSQGSDGNFTVFAKGTPEIYIDSRKIVDIKELQRLKSTDIKDVDIITNPGSQYNAEVKSVIRINTLKHQGDGFSLRTDNYVRYNSSWMAGLEDYLSYRKKGLELFADIDFDTQCYKADNNVLQNVSSINNIRIEQNVNQATRYNTGELKAGFNYEINADHSFGAYFDTSRILHWKATNDGMQNVWVNGALDGTIHCSMDMYRDSNPENTLNAYYNGKLGKMTVDANFTGFWEKDGLSKTKVEGFCRRAKCSAELDNRTVNTVYKQKANLIAGKLVCSYPICGGTFSLGTELSHSYFMSEYNNLEQYIASSQTETKENHTAGFFDYSLPKGDWTYNIGLRYEYVTSKYYDFGVCDDNVSRNYNDWFPSASVSWNKGKWGAQLGYTCKTVRPSYGALRGDVQYDNRYMYEGGNPYLRPSFIHSIDFDLTYSWFSLSVGYAYTKDPINWCATLYDDSEDIAYIRHLNFEKCNEVYASAVLSPKFGWYQPTFELDFSREFFDPQEYGSSAIINKPYFSFDLKNKFVFGNDFSAFLNIGYETDRHTGFRVVNHSTNMSVQVVKSFFNKALTLSLKFNDLLKQNEKWTMYGINVDISKDCYNYTRSAMLTVTYNLNTSKSKYKGTGAGNDERNRL